MTETKPSSARKITLDPDDMLAARAHLESIPLLRHAAADTVTELAACAEFYAVKPRSRLLHEGSDVAFVFFLLRGVVRVSHAHPSGNFSPKVLRSPCQFGHMELIAGLGSVFQSVDVVTDAWVAQVPWDIVRKLLATDHAFALACLEDLAWQFLHTADTVKQIIFGDLRARIANVLLSYAEHGEAAEIDGLTALAINNRQIALHVATSRRSVIRIMRQLHREGVVTPQGKNMVLLDTARLKQKLCVPRVGLVHQGREPSVLACSVSVSRQPDVATL